MADHVLRVGRFLAKLAGSVPFYPSEFQSVSRSLMANKRWLAIHWSSNHNETLPLIAEETLQDLGVLLRRVDNGELYLVKFNGKSEIHEQSELKNVQDMSLT